MLIRQEIVDRFVAQLQRINTANTFTLYGQTMNYLTDVGQNVFPWRSAKFAAGDIPALIVRDLDEPIAESEKRGARVLRQLHMQVEIVTLGGSSMDEVRKMFADVEAAIGEGRETVWADITSDTRPRISRSVLEQESAKVAGGIFECFIDYPTYAFLSRTA